MSRKETIKRYSLFVICLFFMGLGVALTKHGELGVSPISSVANVLLSVVLSLIFFNGQLVGTREGTLISALCVGLVVKFFRSLLQTPLTRILKK